MLWNFCWRIIISARARLCTEFSSCVVWSHEPRHLSDCVVPELVVTSCVRGIHSCIAASNYKQSAFFTKHTIECVRDAIANSQILMSKTSFDPWVNICSAEQSGFENRYMEMFTAHLARKNKSSYQQLRDAKSRSTSDAELSTATCAGSASSSVFGDTSANVVSNVDHGEKRKHASLLGRKHEKDVEPSSSKQKTFNRGAGGSKKAGGSSKKNQFSNIFCFVVSN